ncbi:MAG: hypothetical protein HC933_10285 [Pleurocapsa sp. SU_196_0]|nr:hypothetical protein [Pleurocapsa sp. SU_196_0]
MVGTSDARLEFHAAGLGVDAGGHRGQRGVSRGVVGGGVGVGVRRGGAGAWLV